MSDEIAIKVENVSKTFRLPHEKNNSIKSAAINFYRSKRTYEKQQALEDISFEVKKGEFFGIVGRNGSGKSTLLKILAGIYSPSRGNVHVNGKLTPFIELGVGFNPELTGRENVFLNGALLGFNRKQMQKLYKDIVDFAELERFMDQKLKNYSSGMQVRLAFSIAIRVKSDILVLDEVLAVGDEAFQQKCIDIFEKYQAQKQTIVLVTHDMEIVRRFCSKAMLIHDGEMVSIGDPREVANTYTGLNDAVGSKEMAKNNDMLEEKHSTKIKLLTSNIVKHGDKMRLRVEWSAAAGKVENIGVAIYKNTGEYIFGANTILDEIALKGLLKVEYSLDAMLGNGNYHFKVGVFGKTDRNTIEFINDGPKFTVKSPDLKWEGLTYLPHKWER